MRIPTLFRILIGLVAAALICPASAFGANYPLEITNIKPAGGLASASRIYKAYPGIEYNIRAAVIGGAFPYTFSLANAPTGMTVDSRGVISWTNPQSNASPTLTVRDSEGAQVTVTWPVTVTTAGFRFVSGSGAAAPTGTGTLANPWRNLSDVYNNASTMDIIYFRTGTYSQASLPRVSAGAWLRVEWNSEKPTTWITYPGESPVLDFGHRAGVENGTLIRMGDSIAGGETRAPYIDGFESINISYIGFQTGSPGTFRRLRMHGLRVGGDGTNSAFIMTLTEDPPVVGMVIQDCQFYDAIEQAVTIKIYGQAKLLIEDTVHHHAWVGIELKDDVRRYTVRNNLFHDITLHALGGNMHEVTTNGEIDFNTMLQPGAGQFALDVNQDGMAVTTYIYRNTLVGRVRIRSVDATNGPFYFRYNVIVNSDPGTPAGSHIYHEEVTAPSRIIVSNNLVGYPADGIVDASGRLTAAYSSYLGTHGSQLSGSGSTPTPTAPPGAPSNVRIIR